MIETNKWNQLNIIELGGRLTLAQVEACLFDDGNLTLWESNDIVFAFKFEKFPGYEVFF